jgi:hypothetical protein
MRRKKFIPHLRVDRVLVADQGEKARVVDDFYEHLLGSVPECGFSLDLNYLGVQEHDLSKLEVPFLKGGGVVCDWVTGA